jgi:hypothetical protein
MRLVQGRFGKLGSENWGLTLGISMTLGIHRATAGIPQDTSVPQGQTPFSFFAQSAQTPWSQPNLCHS